MTHVRFLLLGLLAGCSHPAPPLSAEAHEEAAGDEDVLAAADDNALEADEERGCGGSMGPPGMTLVGPCWTVQVDARENHRRDADAHRLAAAAHREAADTLREAESRSCSGLSDEDRDESPFAHRADMLSVTPLLEIAATPEGARRGAGATIVLRQVAGLTVGWLQHSIDCHLARNAVVGHDMPEMAYCPLVPSGVTAEVHPVAGGIAVEIRADGEPEAAEVLRRARALVD